MFRGIRIFVPDLMLHMLDDLKDCIHGLLQGFNGALFFGDDLFPVPLVYIAGVEIIQLLITADRVHIGVKTFARLKIILLQRHALPFCEGMDNLDGLAGHACKVELHRAFHAAQVVI